MRICQGQIFNYLFSLPQSSQPSAIHTSNHIQYLQSPVGNFYLYFYLYLVRLKVSNHLAFLFFANNTILPDLTSLNLPFLFPPPKANVHQVLCYSPTSSPLHHPCQEAPHRLTPGLLPSFAHGPDQSPWNTAFTIPLPRLQGSSALHCLEHKVQNHM